MKLYKRILLLALTLCLILPLAACKTRDTDGWGTTAPDGEVMALIDNADTAAACCDDSHTEGTPDSGV